MSIPAPAAAPLPISGVVITQNEADRIGRCLDSMRGLCAEMIVVDSGSTDDTVAVAAGRLTWTEFGLVHGRKRQA